MFVDSPNLNAAWASLIVEELIRAGVKHFVICPGSRSAPLALAAAQHPRSIVTVHFDERGAAFYALGIGKASRTPAVFVCTSGTAIANALPAVVEASECLVPMILLTADRPPELQDTGANQTIRQTGFFAQYVRWQYDLPCPAFAISPASALTAIDQAVYRASGRDGGPVHLNQPFREPLEPKPEFFDRESWLAPIAPWLRSKKPFTQYASGGAGLQTAVWQEPIRRTQRGLVLAGLLDDAAERDHAVAIARRLDWPILPDPASGLRFVSGTRKTVHFYDAVLGSLQQDVFDGVETILHFGGPLTSKSLNNWLLKARYTNYIRVNQSPRRLDPLQRVTVRVQSDLLGFSVFLDHIEGRAAPDAAWCRRIVSASKRAGKTLDKAFAAGPKLTEQSAVRAAIAALPKRGALFLGNSLPIRHADLFGEAAGKCARVFANRGASGIDGNIATAAGISRALHMPVIAVPGDLAALHDLNSLALLRGPESQVILVVLNNNGGGIFHMLPIADYPEHFESLFGTPHGRNFAGAAAMFGIGYSSPASRLEFEQNLEKALASGGSHLLEVRSDREATARLTREIRAALQDRR